MAIPLAAVILALRLGAIRTVIVLIALAHVTILADQALFPIPIRLDYVLAGRAAQAELPGSNLNLVPFATIRPALAAGAPAVARQTAFLNLFVLSPAAIYLPLLVPRLRRLRAFVPVGILIGVSVELAQLAVSLFLGFRYRAIDVDDVILNTAGVFLAYAVFLAAVRATRRSQPVAAPEIR